MDKTKISLSLATLAIIVAICVAIFGGGKDGRDGQNGVDGRGGLSGDSGFNSIQFQSLGDYTNYLSVGGVKIKIAGTSGVASTTVLNNSGATLWVTGTLVTTGSASSTMNYAYSTTSTATQSSQSSFAVITTALDILTSATGTQPTSSNLTSTSTSNYASSVSVFPWRNGEYIFLQKVASAQTCASGSGSTADNPTRGHCSAATSTDLTQDIELHLNFTQ